MSTVKNKNITSEQCKSARALLNWSQDDLVTHSGVGKSTIADFERKKRSLFERTLSNIIDTFEENGIIFEDTDEFITIKLKK